LTTRQQRLGNFIRLPRFSRLDPAKRRDQILDAASALLAERP
jgi:hypothetical protein